MNAVILCVGKIREAWQQAGCDEYLKRLSRYGKYTVLSVPDEAEPTHASALQIERIRQKEGQALLRALRPDDRVVCLSIRAHAPDSPGLARKMASWSAEGRRVALVIGGSNGLSPEVIARADEEISFSNLTFPHGLMRVILLEQLYRGEKILAGEKYHK